MKAQKLCLDFHSLPEQERLLKGERPLFKLACVRVNKFHFARLLGQMKTMGIASDTNHSKMPGK